MRRIPVRKIGNPISVHLEYGELTMSELGRLLSSYHSALRNSWKMVPTMGLGLQNPRLLTTSVSTGNSIDMVVEYAFSALTVTTLMLGPAITWPSMVRQSFRLLGISLRIIAEQRGESDSIVLDGLDRGIDQTPDPTPDAPVVFRMGIDEEGPYAEAAPGILDNPVAANAFTRAWESTLNAHVLTTMALNGPQGTETIKFGSE